MFLELCLYSTYTDTAQHLIAAAIFRIYCRLCMYDTYDRYCLDRCMSKVRCVLFFARKSYLCLMAPRLIFRKAISRFDVYRCLCQPISDCFFFPPPFPDCWAALFFPRPPQNPRDLDITLRLDHNGSVMSLHASQEYRLR